MIRRIALGGIVILGSLGFIALAWCPSIPPISRPGPQSFSADSVAPGESRAAAGHCASCQTGEGGQQFTGGYGVNAPFGVIYGTNITSDVESGIGNWSLAAFTRAMREGVSRNGYHLFPAFPYYAFTKLSDEDIAAQYAYLMTRPPARATVPHNTVPFPLSIRALEAGWKLLFFRSVRFQRNPSKSNDWKPRSLFAAAKQKLESTYTTSTVMISQWNRSMPWRLRRTAFLKSIRGINGSR